MVDTNSLLQTLFSGGADDNTSGFQALAGAEPTTGATVLARLRGGAKDGVGALGKLGSADNKTGLDTTGSRIGAIASGLSAGLDQATANRAAQQKHALELMKLQWDHNYKLADLKQKVDNNTATAAENKRYHDILDKYYTGQNEKKDKSDTFDPSSPKSILDAEKSRTARAKSIGLFDQGLANHSIGEPAHNGARAPTEEQTKSAQEELARRRQEFRDWDAQQPWSKNGKSAGVPKVGNDDNGDPAATGGEGDPDTTGGDPNIPTPPSRPTDLTPPPEEKPRLVFGPDGKRYNWTKSGGLTPATDADADTALPSGSPPPPGMTDPNEAPAPAWDQ
jgi:hypothetical protein